jgi:hypothetical protein
MKPNESELLAKLKDAVAAANEAEKTVETARTELVSASKTVGLLLLEAKKLHPAVKDFEAFLKRVDGLKLSRAYDLMRLAGGRATEEEIRKDTRDRVKKHRASKKKLPKPAPAPKKPEPKPDPISVTGVDVTEPAETGAEKRKPEKGDAKQSSAHALAEFNFACRTWLPKMTEADQHKARQLVLDLTEPKAEAA